MSLDTTAIQDYARCGVRTHARSHVGPRTIPILRSGLFAQEFCRSAACAELVVVFERSLYLRSGQEFICVGERTVGNGPLTLIADFGPGNHLSHLGLKPGSLASIADSDIFIGNSVRLTVDRCELWRPPPWPRRPADGELKEICSAVARLQAAEAPEEGLGRLSCALELDKSPLACRARSRVARFEACLDEVLDSQHAATMSPDAVTGLIGLGPGLTPSGDDFLVGALALLDALAEHRARDALARAIVTAPRGLTSPLSNCFLRAAAVGHVGEHLHRAISGLMNGAPEQAVAAIRTVGHSSGWDMLAGAATALRIVAAGISA